MRPRKNKQKKDPAASAQPCSLPRHRFPGVRAPSTTGVVGANPISTQMGLGDRGIRFLPTLPRSDA